MQLVDVFLCCGLVVFMSVCLVFGVENVPCPQKTFQNQENGECTPCTPFEDHIEGNIIKTACNATHDLVTGCKKGYHRPPHAVVEKRQKCEVCSRCRRSGMFKARACSEYNDTVCCPKANMVVKYNENNYPRCFPGPARKHPSPAFSDVSRQHKPISKQGRKEQDRPHEAPKLAELTLQKSTPSPLPDNAVKRENPILHQETCAPGQLYNPRTSKCETCPGGCVRRWDRHSIWFYLFVLVVGLFGCYLLYQMNLFVKRRSGASRRSRSSSSLRLSL